MVEPDVHVPPPVPVTIENVPGPAVLVIVGAPLSVNASVPLFVSVIVPVFGAVAIRRAREWTSAQVSRLPKEN